MWVHMFDKKVCLKISHFHISEISVILQVIFHIFFDHGLLYLSALSNGRVSLCFHFEF